MQKTIYIPSDVKWDDIEAEAKKRGIGVGAMLCGSWKKDSQLDRIEGMLKTVLDRKQPEPQNAKLLDDEPFVSEPKYVPSYSDGNVRPIPKDLPKEKKLEALKAMPYFRPMPKKGANG